MNARARSNRSRIVHDQLLKEALSAFLPDFVSLFAPQQAQQLDFATLRFLDKEVFTDLAAGERREMDLVAEVRTRDGNPQLVLIHVEIQRRRQAEFARRMLRYFMSLHLRFPEHHILPMALVSYPGAAGVGVGTATLEVAGFTALRYHYIEVSLPSLEAANYVAAPQPLAVGLAALMRGPRRGERDRLYEACLRRLTQLEAEGTIDQARLFLLHNLVRTYLTLTIAERTRLLSRLDAEGATAVKTTELTWADRMRLEGEAKGRAEGEAKGRAEGEAKGRAEAVLVLLRDRFGTVPAEVEERIVAIRDLGELDALLVRAPHVAHPDELLR